MSAVRDSCLQYGEGPGDNCGHDPVGETSQRTSLGANGIGKYFRNKNPDYGALRQGKKSNKADQVKNDILIP